MATMTVFLGQLSAKYGVVGAKTGVRPVERTSFIVPEALIRAFLALIFPPTGFSSLPHGPPRRAV
jgi:hypothetical protein